MCQREPLSRLLLACSVAPRMLVGLPQSMPDGMDINTENVIIFLNNKINISDFVNSTQKTNKELLLYTF